MEQSTSVMAEGQPVDWDELDGVLFEELPAFDDGELTRIGSKPIMRTPLFRHCCANGAEALDVAALRAATGAEWCEAKPNGGTPLHVLCANVNVTAEALQAVASNAPQSAWTAVTKQGANPLHRLLGNKRLTQQLLRVAAQAAPKETWLQVTIQGATPAHRLCGNSGAPITATMLKIAGDAAPPETWKIQKGPGTVTALDVLLGKKMKAFRNAEMVREAAKLMDGGGGGATGFMSPNATADWKTQAAIHFFSLAASNGSSVGTQLPAPIIRVPGKEEICVAVRMEVAGKTKGECLKGCEKGSVFAEAKNAIANSLEPFRNSTKVNKEASETWFKSALTNLKPGGEWPKQSGHLFEFFELPVAKDETWNSDYYVFTLKVDSEMPEGVSRADFLRDPAAAVGPGTPAVPAATVMGLAPVAAAAVTALPAAFSAAPLPEDALALPPPAKRARPAGPEEPL